MDDLSSVKWTAPKVPPASQQYPQASGNYYPVLRPTSPISGRSTSSTVQQAQRPSSNAQMRSNASTPANDSFASLVSFNASQSTKGLSLQEQQKTFLEKKSRQEAERNKAFDRRFGSAQTASALGNGRITPDQIASPPTYTATSDYGGHKLSKVINKPFAGISATTLSTNAPASAEDENDLLAAFDASASVRRASHMPEPSRSPRGFQPGHNGTTLEADSSSPLQEIAGKSRSYIENSDDDPFGLGTAANKVSSGNGPATNGINADDDDVLGLLSRPVSEFTKEPEAKSTAPACASNNETHPQDHAIAELVDMGFTTDRSRRALESTESGTDVQAAVGWLLNQAHEESRNQKRPTVRDDGNGNSIRTSQTKKDTERRKSSDSGGSRPAWMREQRQPNARPTRADSKSPANSEKDPAQYATDIGNKMFKTAGSLWKTGTKKLNQAVQDFNLDSDSSQPKWMREAQPEPGTRKSRPQQRGSDVHDHDRMEKKPRNPPAAFQADASVTYEALMLEADSRPAPRKPRAKIEPLSNESDYQRQLAPPVASRSREQVSPQPKFMQQTPAKDSKAKISRQAVEEESSQAYISPARRKRAIPEPITAEPGPDLLFDVSMNSSKPTPSQPTISQPTRIRPNPSPQPRTTRVSTFRSHPSPPKREVPSLSHFALQASTKSRQEGNSAFKRGDYAQATTHYSSGISAVPSTHPIAIVLFTNRALSHSKTGDPKASLADARSALDLIGLSRGAGETIDFGEDEKAKQMSTYWEKAMMRQAEALEHLERWSDAAMIWRTCVEAGVGGATSSAGRNRCEKAAAPPSQPKASSVPKKAQPKARPKPAAQGDLAPDSDSVTRLRAANAAADRLDDEKFALADVVDQRVSRWRAGKEGNLRALLSTLENVLWEDSGWKKVGMGDLLLPGKVKMVYMKGIAKVHPDKLSTTATTEQKMISAAVFATLNEAWERFKAENGL